MHDFKMLMHTILIKIILAEAAAYFSFLTLLSRVTWKHRVIQTFEEFCVQDKWKKVSEIWDWIWVLQPSEKAKQQFVRDAPQSQFLFNKSVAYVPGEDIKGKHQLKNRKLHRQPYPAHCSPDCALRERGKGKERKVTRRRKAVTFQHKLHTAIQTAAGCQIIVW